MLLSEALAGLKDQVASRPLRRSLIAAAIVLVVGTSVAGCGFQPLYGQTSSGKQLTEILAGLEISPIPGRVGQRIRNDLIFYKTGGGEAAPSGDYRLDIAIRESIQSTLVASNGIASGQVYAIDATFKLVRVKDGKVVLTGNSYARSPYETNKIADPNTANGTSIGRSVYANVRASYDAQDQSATQVASDIKTRVAAFLSTAA